MRQMILTMIMAATLAMFPVLAQADGGGSQGNGNNGGSSGSGSSDNGGQGGNSQSMGNGSHENGQNGDEDGGEAHQTGKDSEGIGNDDRGNGDGTHESKGFGYKVGAFVDEDGDGFNDLAPDADGDGIPNGLDPDFQAPKGGSGNQFGKDPATGETDEESLTGYRAWFSFLIAPMTVLSDAKGGFGPDSEAKGTQSVLGNGPGDGSGFSGEGAGDGTGFGPGGTTGDCDGSGPNRPDRNNNDGRNQQGGRH